MCTSLATDTLIQWVLSFPAHRPSHASFFVYGLQLQTLLSLFSLALKASKNCIGTTLESGNKASSMKILNILWSMIPFIFLFLGPIISNDYSLWIDVRINSVVNVFGSAEFNFLIKLQNSDVFVDTLSNRSPYPRMDKNLVQYCVKYSELFGFNLQLEKNWSVHFSRGQISVLRCLFWILEGVCVQFFVEEMFSHTSRKECDKYQMVL